MSNKTQTENIEDLLNSVNNASQHVRNFYITFLLASVYVGIIIWSTTDLMLLLETPVNLPLLSVELPITDFYSVTPYLYLLLHFNLLLQLCLLADKLKRFNYGVSTLTDQNLQNYFYSRLFPFAFTHTLSGQHHSLFLRFLLTVMVWVTIIWLPLFILMSLQVGFLAYHSTDILYFQRLAIVIDLALLAIFWPIIRTQNSNAFTWIMQASGISFILKWVSLGLQTRTFQSSPKLLHSLTQLKHLNHSKTACIEGGLCLITFISVILFSWAVAVLPDSKYEKQAASWFSYWPSICPSKETGDHYFKLTEYLFDGVYQSADCKKESRVDYIFKKQDPQKYFVESDSKEEKPQDSIFNRNLRVKEQLLIGNKLQPEDEVNLTNENMEIRESALKKTIGLVLSNRDLRYADFSRSLLPKVDFIGAYNKPSNLRHAKFTQTLLAESRMNATDLQGTILILADLQGADLLEAKLQRADLSNANLQGANLSLANLQGAVLIDTELQGAILSYAKLQGANLEFANLQGANLYFSKLQGADLSHATLYGSALNMAEFQGTDLTAALLQGAELRMAKLQSANLSHADLTLTDLTLIQVGQLKNKELNEILQEVFTSTQDLKFQKEFKLRLSESAKEFTKFDEAKGNKIWSSESNELVYTTLYNSSNKLEAAKDESDYLNSLSPYLMDLSCQNKWVFSNIILDRMLNNPFLFKSNVVQCLNSLKDKRNDSQELICPSMSGINNDTNNKLKLMVARKFPPSDTKPIFECKTELSD